MGKSERPQAESTAQGQNGTEASFAQRQNDAVSRLRERAEADSVEIPAAWYAEPGDELVGTFVCWSSGHTKRGESHRIAIIENEAGTRLAGWAFYKVLRTKLEELDPQPGETLLIQRKKDRVAKQSGPGGNPITYRDFSVVVDRP